MEKTILFVNVTFNNIYEWGKGWLTTEKCEQYEKALDKWNGTFFKVLKTLNCGGEYLVGAQGSAYLHPMGFKITLTSCGVKCNGSYFDSEIGEISEFAEHVANYCGGTYTMQVSKEKTVEFEFE